MNKISILIIGADEKINTDIKSKLISAFNDEIKTIVTTQDGEYSIELIGDLCPEMIILDIKVHKMNGIDIMEKLKTMNLKKIPMIFVFTDIADEVVVKRTMELGAMYYILRPVELEILVERVKFFYGIEEGKGSDDVEYLIVSTMHEYGLLSNMLGYKYIKQAVEFKLSSNDGKRVSLYKMVAEIFGVTPKKVERAIRHVVNKIFKEDVSIRPKNLEFVSYIADRVSSQLN